MIHPLNQHSVECLVNYAKANNVQEDIVVFGSSVRDDCTLQSDLDVLVYGKDYVAWNEFCLDDQKCDMLFLDDLDPSEHILENIKREGVRVFESG